MKHCEVQNVPSWRHLDHARRKRSSHSSPKFFASDEVLMNAVYKYRCAHSVIELDNQGIFVLQRFYMRWSGGCVLKASLHLCTLFRFPVECKHSSHVQICECTRQLICGVVLVRAGKGLQLALQDTCAKR